MIVVIDRPFDDAIYGTSHEQGDYVVLPEAMGNTYIAIGVAHLAPTIPEELAPEVNAEIQQAVEAVKVDHV